MNAHDSTFEQHDDRQTAECATDELSAHDLDAVVAGAGIGTVAPEQFKPGGYAGLKGLWWEWTHQLF
ncbi:hypothetical protein M446_1879 [Methylobacterium sp. 4-46]|uniref:hypothetical protein n=1 Tax=unclassified Methylobacterium TaxID=2615210 RepID=UPI000165CA06|nr:MULTISPECIES: hypothetical protein [Methylobacterium]ACA16358.1 hypothetical protein M446_1879 [Methylobacterium sp. 4-46]WFT82067.1 hypothetical protein QA634_09520 [Methylobacterium nodulans]